MNQSIVLGSMNEDDRVSVIDLFNYYVENSFAAYPQEKVSYDAYNLFLSFLAKYPGASLRNDQNELVGFGFLHAYNPMSTFKHTAEISYFLHPSYTGHGFGKILLDHLLEEGKKRGIDVVVASISSLNEASLKFHKSHGFNEAGRIEKAGRKKGQYFDVVLMQKNLDSVKV